MHFEGERKMCIIIMQFTWCRSFFFFFWFPHIKNGDHFVPEPNNSPISYHLHFYSHASSSFWITFASIYFMRVAALFVYYFELHERYFLCRSVNLHTHTHNSIASYTQSECTWLVCCYQILWSYKWRTMYIKFMKICYCMSEWISHT